MSVRHGRAAGKSFSVFAAKLALGLSMMSPVRHHASGCSLVTAHAKIDDETQPLFDIDREVALAAPLMAAVGLPLPSAGSVIFSTTKRSSDSNLQTLYQSMRASRTTATIRCWRRH
jgi:hypothetical protein